jgi:hypothetical protein
VFSSFFGFCLRNIFSHIKRVSRSHFKIYRTNFKSSSRIQKFLYLSITPSFVFDILYIWRQLVQKWTSQCEISGSRGEPVRLSQTYFLLTKRYSIY